MTALAEQALALLVRLEAVDSEDVDAVELARLRTLRKRIGVVSGEVAERQALQQTLADFEESGSRRSTERALRMLTRSRPWRAKIVRRAAEDGWTIQAKTYTNEGTVVLYAATVAEVARLMETLDPVLDPLRQWPDEDDAA